MVDLMAELRRRRCHGLMVVGVCLAQPSASSEVGGAPVYGGLGDVTGAAYSSGMDTVAVPGAAVALILLAPVLTEGNNS